jgi:hypothetical protein
MSGKSSEPVELINLTNLRSLLDLTFYSATKFRKIGVIPPPFARSKGCEYWRVSDLRSLEQRVNQHRATTAAVRAGADLSQLKEVYG